MMANPLTNLMILCRSQTRIIARQFSNTRARLSSIAAPQENVDSIQVSPKIENLVDAIGNLTLIEVSELNSVLKKRLNLPDVAPMAFGAMNMGAPAPAEDEEVAQAAKSSYTVKLLKYDDTKKVALIKEIKSLLQDMNLVQAKKFIESAPVVVKADVGKEEAEQLKEALAKHGAECTID